MILWCLLACGGSYTYFAPGAPTLPPCAQASPALPPRDLRVEVLVGDGVEPRDVAAMTAAASAVWEPLGLHIRPTRQSTRAPVRYALGGSSDTMAAATPELARASAAREVLAPLAPILAKPSDSDVRLLVVERLSAPDSLAEMALGDAHGLTLVADALPTSLSALLPVGPPLAIVSVAGWRAHRPQDADLLVAHELGHALGLEHSSSSQGIMTPHPVRCQPTAAAAAAKLPQP